jgi:WD40 repeat protein
MFSCNDGVVCVVDFYMHTEKVAEDLYREGVSDTPLQEPVNVKVTCISMAPSTSYLAVGGADGQVAVYDSTCDWAETHLLDIGSHNDMADSRAPKQVKVTALSWSPDNTFLIIGDNRGNIFLVTTVGRVAMTHSVASSGRSSAMVEMLLPSDEPAAKPAWRIVKALFNRAYTYADQNKLHRQDRKNNKKKEKKQKEKRGNSSSSLPADSSDDEEGRVRDRDRSSSLQKSNDERDYEDGYHDFRRDPLEAVTCLSWSSHMEYLIAGRRNRELTLYLHEGKNFG